MWPLSLALFAAIAAQPQQNSSVAGNNHVGKIPRIVNMQSDRLSSRKLSSEAFADQNQNTCFFIRSYHFRRQDGQAPVPAGVTTCTPANTLRQRQVSTSPRVMYVPLEMQQDSQSYQQK